MIEWMKSNFFIENQTFAPDLHLFFSPVNSNLRRSSHTLLMFPLHLIQWKKIKYMELFCENRSYALTCSSLSLPTPSPKKHHAKVSALKSLYGEHCFIATSWFCCTQEYLTHASRMKTMFYMFSRKMELLRPFNFVYLFTLPPKVIIWSYSLKLMINFLKDGES